ncbi:MAG: ABC transporter ATP-binding protein [Thermoleophilia bacterium]|nr:ABC transporter ATP-binding protein [Thermoleophilia bacterium]
MSDAILEIEGLHKTFGRDFIAVEDFNLTLAESGSIGVVGESGSGKTTVARMIVGLETPTSGSIRFRSTDRSRPARRAKERRARGSEIQIVFQDPYASLDPRQTCSSCLDEVLRLHTDLKKADRKARIAELSELVGLDERQRNAMPRELSGGQHQRVALARALAADPSILVLDEAVAALDVSIQAQILNLLADIRRATGVAYVFISHDLAVIRQTTDQAIVMQKGSVVESGSTERVLDHPESDYTKVLRASVPREGWKPQHLASPNPKTEVQNEP